MKRVKSILTAIWCVITFPVVLPKMIWQIDNAIDEASKEIRM